MDNPFELEQIEKLKGLFAHEGWKIFMSDMEQNLRAVNHLGDIQGSQQLGVRQGMTQALTGILAYQTTIETVEQQIIEDQAAAAENDDDDA